jgi:hypothetical protein
MRKSVVIAIGLLVSACALAAGDPQEVRSLAAGAAPAAATIDDMKPLLGDWVTDGAAAAFSPAIAGQIVGHLTLSMGDKPFVEELWIIRPEGSSVLLRQKHFGADLLPLQEPPRWLERKLVAKGPHELFFEDLTFSNRAQQLVMKVKIPGGPGKEPQVVTYSFHRPR